MFDRVFRPKWEKRVRRNRDQIKNIVINGRRGPAWTAGRIVVCTRAFCLNSLPRRRSSNLDFSRAGFAFEEHCIAVGIICIRSGGRLTRTRDTRNRGVRFSVIICFFVKPVFVFGHRNRATSENSDTRHPHPNVFVRLVNDV